MYQIAYDYFQEHGSLWVSPNYITPQGISLGDWISKQRRKYFGKSKHSPLTTVQIEKLESIGMIWEPYEVRWMKKYNLAKEYYLAHGHLCIPVEYITSCGIKLGMWISSQRQAERGNPNFLMTDKRKKQLNDIDMIWYP